MKYFLDALSLIDQLKQLILEPIVGNSKVPSHLLDQNFDFSIAAFQVLLQDLAAIKSTTSSHLHQIFH